MSSVKLVIGVVVRHAMTFFFAWLVTKGLADQSEIGILPIPEIAMGAAGALVTVGWSLWQKAVSKWKFLQGLQSHPATTSDAIENRAKLATASEKLAALAH